MNAVGWEIDFLIKVRNLQGTQIQFSVEEAENVSKQLNEALATIHGSIDRLRDGQTEGRDSGST